MPRFIGRGLVDVDARALFDRSHAAQEEVASSELRLEHRAPLSRDRYEQSARSLGVVAQHHERVRHALQGEVTAGEVAVSRIAARPNASPRDLESAVDR